MSQIINNKTIDESTELINTYLNSLNDKDIKSYNIAKSHLGTSFQVEKSNHFLKWKNSITSTTPSVFVCGLPTSTDGINLQNAVE